MGRGCDNLIIGLVIFNQNSKGFSLPNAKHMVDHSTRRYSTQQQTNHNDTKPKEYNFKIDSVSSLYVNFLPVVFGYDSGLVSTETDWFLLPSGAGFLHSEHFCFSLSVLAGTD